MADACKRYNFIFTFRKQSSTVFFFSFCVQCEKIFVLVLDFVLAERRNSHKPMKTFYFSFMFLAFGERYANSQFTKSMHSHRYNVSIFIYATAQTQTQREREKKICISINSLFISSIVCFFLPSSHLVCGFVETKLFYSDHVK